MIDPYSISTEQGVMETSNAPSRVLGAETMEDNLKVSIRQHPRQPRKPLTYPAGNTNQKLPSELENLHAGDSKKSYEDNTPEYFGRTIVTPNRTYRINGCGKIEDVFVCPIDIETIAGLDKRICSFAVNNPARGPTREELRLLIEKYGKKPQKGDGLAILLSKIDAEKRGCKINYVIDYPISEIK